MLVLAMIIFGSGEHEAKSEPGAEAGVGAEGVGEMKSSRRKRIRRAQGGSSSMQKELDQEPTMENWVPNKSEKEDIKDDNLERIVFLGRPLLRRLLRTGWATCISNHGARLVLKLERGTPTTRPDKEWGMRGVFLNITLIIAFPVITLANHLLQYLWGSCGRPCC